MAAPRKPPTAAISRAGGSRLCGARFPGHIVQNATYFCRELLTAIRLAQELDPGIETAVVDNRILGIAGGEQNFQPRDGLARIRL